MFFVLSKVSQPLTIVHIMSKLRQFNRKKHQTMDEENLSTQTTQIHSNLINPNASLFDIFSIGGQFEHSCVVNTHTVIYAL